MGTCAGPFIQKKPAYFCQTNSFVFHHTDSDSPLRCDFFNSNVWNFEPSSFSRQGVISIGFHLLGVVIKKS